MSDEERWEIEYQEFEKVYPFKLRQIIEAIYKYDGFIVTTEDFQPNRRRCWRLSISRYMGVDIL